jgi:hypothetical protein
LGILGCTLAGLFWVMLPFFEKDKTGLIVTASARSSQIRTLTGGLSVFALAYVVGMTIYGFLAK